MKYVYIENYLRIPQNIKKTFLNSINKCKDFKVSNQKIIFCEESLILGFLNGSDIGKVCDFCKDFFKDFDYIKVNIVSKALNKANQMILTFDDTNRQIRI